MRLLRDNADFRRLWLAQTLSKLGSQVTYLALPLTAATVLGASPAQMGLLTAAGSLPAPLLGIVAGTMVDRRPRRPVMVSTDLARALLLALIPLAWLTGSLTLSLVFAVAFLAGACALLFDLAAVAFAPAVLTRRELVEGNSGLELSRSAAEVTGPAVAGLLVQVVRAPLAVAADALSFLASALLIARIRTPEPAHAPSEPFWRAAVAGIPVVLRDPTIRSLALMAGGLGLFNALIESVVILYLVREVGMPPALLGLVFGVGGLGFVLGALLPTRLVAALGAGRTLVLALAVIGLSDLALPLVGRDLVLVAVAIGAGQFFFGLGLTVLGVVQVSLRQALVPDRLAGRVGGLIRIAGWGAAPVGALIGGVLGQIAGLQPTLVVGAMLEVSVAVWVLRSPLGAIRAIPVAAED
jgi:MFS family permease